MKTRILFLGFMATALAWVAPAFTYGATYYVAKTGNNSYSCMQAQSASTPKLTINSGISCLAAGDTLIIKAGTYVEGINDTIPSGTSTAARTTIRANAGDTVIIRPATGVGPDFLHGVYITKSYVAVDSLVIDGVNVSLPFRLNGTATGNLLQNSEIKSVQKTGGSNCVTVQGSVTNASVINNKIHDCGNPAANLHHGIYLKNTGHLVEANEIYNTTSYGVHVYDGTNRTGNIIVRYNYIHHNGNRGILIGSGDNNIAHHNIVANNASYGIEVGFNAATNQQVYNNTIYGNGLNCINVKTSSSNAKVKNNFCLRNGTNTILNSGTGSVLANNRLSTDLTLVVDPQTNQFSPRESSPLIDAGENISGFSSGKFLGLAPDQGAIEFAPNNVVTNPTPTVPAAPSFLQVTPQT
jgi:hypothetical protein